MAVLPTLGRVRASRTSGNAGHRPRQPIYRRTSRCEKACSIGKIDFADRELRLTFSGPDAVGFADCDSRKARPARTRHSLKHAASDSPRLRGIRIGPEVCICEDGYFVDDCVYAAMSITKPRLDNSGLRILGDESHSLDAETWHICANGSAFCLFVALWFWSRVFGSFGSAPGRPIRTQRLRRPARSSVSPACLVLNRSCLSATTSRERRYHPGTSSAAP